MVFTDFAQLRNFLSTEAQGARSGL